MLTRWRKVWADFWSNKTRSFLMVLTILVGVFSVGLVNNMARMMNNDMDSDYQSSNPPEAIISATPLNDDWVGWMRAMPGVKDADGRTQMIAKWITPAGQSTNIQISALKSFANIRVGQLKPAGADGLLPTPGRQQVVFDRSAETLGLQPGETIEIELPGGVKRSLLFTGYVHDVTTFPYGMSGVVSGYITQDTAEWLGAAKGYNELLVSVSENPTDRAHVSDVMKKISDRMDKNGVTVEGVNMYNPGHHFAWQITQGVIFILGLFGWMTVVLSGFLIVNTIVALMSQQTRQIGVMKAIGADAWQIFPMYLVLLLGFGGLAFAISVPLSFWAAAQLLKFMAVFLNFDLSQVNPYPDVVWLQAAIAFLTPLLAAIVPVLNGLRIPVREALNSYGLGGSSQTSTAKESRFSFIARPVLLSLRNAFRRKTRVSLTIITLVLGGAIFIAVFNLWASFDKVMVDIQGYFLADINISLTHNYAFKPVQSAALAVPGVQSVEGWLTNAGKLLSPDEKKEDEVTFVAPPSDSTLIRPSMVQGRWLMPGDKNVIVIGNQLQTIRPDLQVGDWVTVKLNDKKTKWQIIGFYRMPGNVNPPLIYANYEYLGYLVGMTNQVYDLRVITYDHTAGPQAAISEELQKQFKPRKIGVAYVQTSADWYQQQKSQTDVLVYNMLIMACLIAAVGGLGLASTMSLNVMERTREIGVMRAIGASDANIQQIVITEGLVIGLLSWMLGVVFSIPITYVLDYGVGVSVFQSPLDVVFSWSGSLVWLLGMLLISALASMAPAWRASRLAVRETLVYE